MAGEHWLKNCHTACSYGYLAWKIEQNTFRLTNSLPFSVSYYLYLPPLSLSLFLHLCFSLFQTPLLYADRSHFLLPFVPKRNVISGANWWPLGLGLPIAVGERFSETGNGIGRSSACSSLYSCNGIERCWALDSASLLVAYIHSIFHFTYAIIFLPGHNLFFICRSSHDMQMLPWTFCICSSYD